jgi:malate dehydrogenase
VKNLVQQIAKTCPQACIGIITNPVNTTVAIAAEVLKKRAFTIRTNCLASLRWTSSVQIPLWLS